MLKFDFSVPTMGRMFWRHEPISHMVMIENKTSEQCLGLIEASMDSRDSLAVRKLYGKLGQH